MSRRRFRPMPIGLRRRRVSYEELAKFYGRYISGKRRRKRYNFAVNVPPMMSLEDKGRYIRMVYNETKHGRLPQHKMGQVFNGFDELFATPWIKVRKMLEYHAGMEYVR